MRTSTVAFISGLAAVASATTSTWGSTTSTSSSTSSSSYDPTLSGAWSTSSTTTKAAVSTSSSYDPSWSAWTSTSTSTSTSYDPTWSAWTSTSTGTSYDPTWSAWTSTSTSYDPTWSAWTSTSYDPSWSAWGSSYTTPVAATTPCPVWTGGATPPAYYTNLPGSIKSALPSWTGAPPSDYCYYTSWMQSFSSCTAPAVVSPTTFASTAAKATGTSTAYGTWSGTTGVAPIATFKGAANVNAVSYAVAGLAAAAALVMA